MAIEWEAGEPKGQQEQQRPTNVVSILHLRRTMVGWAWVPLGWCLHLGFQRRLGPAVPVARRCWELESTNWAMIAGALLIAFSTPDLTSGIFLTWRLTYVIAVQYA